MFRSDAVVQKFSPPRSEDFRVFMFYPSMRSAHPEVGEISELFDALRAAKLKALARRNVPGATVEEVPVAEWFDLVADVGGPYRHLDGGGRDYPWIKFQILRADVEKLWRRTSEKQGRTKYDWVRLKEIYQELRSLHDDFSQNRLIEELQATYQEETGKPYPERSTIQNHIRNW